MRVVLPCALLALISSSVIAQVSPTTPQAPGRATPQIRSNGTDTAANTAALMRSNGGSLLRASLAAQPDPSVAKASQISFFAVPPPTPRVLKKHDLVTIIVREESESTSEGNADLKKEMDFDAKLEQFIKLNLAGGALENSIGESVPQIKFNAARNFKGEATVDRSDSLTLRIQAEILDVKPNNTLVLQARASITTDDEVQSMILSGTCRAEDVTPDNTVLSTQLYDKSITKSHKGAVRDNTKRGWVPRLLDVLNPF